MSYAPKPDKQSRFGDVSGRLVTLLAPDGVAAEAYRTLRTSLLYSPVELPLQVIVVSSPGSREGKSTVCANLGVVLAQADNQVLLLDCNLRKPDLHEVFGLSNSRGLVDVLTGRRTVQQIWHKVLPGLKVVTGGFAPSEPAEHLSSRRFGEFLEQARQEFDYVLMDTPPLGLASDAEILATQSDGLILVLDARRTSKASVRRAMHRLETIGARVLGTVMNNFREDRDGYR